MTIKQFVAELEKSGTYITINDFDTFTTFCCRNNVKYNYGASRLCAIFPKENMVLKINREEMINDYCEMEINYYQRAVSLGIADLLLPISVYTTLPNGVKVYCQPMYSYSVDGMNWEKENKLQKKYRKIIDSKAFRKICDGFYGHRAPSIWLASAISIYGKRFLRIVEDWTKENRINDLHSGNVGFLKGKPIIIDYAGFHD